MFDATCCPTQYWAEQTPERIALIFQGGDSSFFKDAEQAGKVSISWAELHQLVLSVATYLSGNVTQMGGNNANGIVAYAGSQRFNGLLIYLAVIALGGKVLMLNPALSVAQRNALCDELGVSILITDQHFATFSKNLTACCQLPAFDYRVPATLTLTSGSSGKPKAIVHSVQNHLENALGVCDLMDFTAEKSWLLSLPLFHVSGQGIVWRWLLQGARLHINEDKSTFFDSLAEVSHASLVPTQLQRYLARLDKPLSFPKKCLLGGAFIPNNLVEEAKNRNIVTFSGYGMTEMASTICAVKNEIGNVGTPLKGRTVQIVDQEIWVKGAGLALGIWQKNGEIRPLVNAEGWLQTKDKGEWNAQGQLIVQGRLDNMFISGGENIQPEAIEATIYACELVEQVFVLPLPDKEFGHRPVAFIQFKNENKRSDFEANLQLLRQFLSDKLEKFKQPVRYFSLDFTATQQGAIKISRTLLQQTLATILRTEAEKDN